MVLSAYGLAAVLLGLALCHDCPPAPAPMPRVLGGEPALRQLAEAGHARSPTFRRLLSELQARSGFVILAWSPALGGRLNGALMDRIRTTPDGVRCLWIGLRPTRATDELLPLLAHELQHAVEALRSGTPDDASLEPFFKRIAVSRHLHGYETAAALEVQAEVRSELRKSSGGDTRRR